ncbi:MAG: alkaline shock response membrane anchor protein AmaP [Chloroflexota bacterium]|nr:alkaline shock response membrane anchor protein AmaP [Chloroflexota bacterium]
MNTFNRIVIVILLLVLISLFSMFFVIPHSVLTNTGAWMQGLGEQLWNMNPWLRLPVGILLALLFDALAGFIIYLEVRRTEKFITVQNVAGGEATISEKSIIQQIKSQVGTVPEVSKVAPQVKSQRGGVKTRVEVLVNAGADVPALASEMVGLIKQVVEGDLGLKLAQAPQVRIKVAAPTSKKTPGQRKITSPPVAPTRVKQSLLPEPGTPAPAISEPPDFPLVGDEDFTPSA